MGMRKKQEARSKHKQGVVLVWLRLLAHLQEYLIDEGNIMGYDPRPVEPRKFRFVRVPL